MVVSSRKIAASSLALVGLGFLTGQLLGQGQRDEAARRTAANSTTAPKPAALPAVIGTIDVERVLKEYDKFKFLGEEFQAAFLAKKNELMKLGTEMQQHAEAMQKFTPGSPDFKKYEDKITFLKAQMDAKKEQAQREFEMKEAESLATLYKEIQDMASRVAYQRKMSYVLKSSNQQISGADPKSVMAAMSSTVMYADPQNDITDDVINYLNIVYRKNGGQPPKGAATARAATQPGAPAEAPAPAAAASPAAGAQR